MNKNKGFSLVELIIVIAIMAILTGTLAPTMIKYVEKAKISSDQQLLNAIYTTIIYSSTDPSIMEDPASVALFNAFSNGPVPLENLMTPANNRLANSLLEVLGWQDLNQTTYEKYIRSAHKSDCKIYIASQGGLKNPLVMWISTTDKSGKRNTSNNATTVADIGNCITIQ